MGRVVTSGGSSVGVWTVNAGASPALKLSYTTAAIPGDQDPGFFTSVSTNGTIANSGVIWAVGRADGSANEYISLNAFAAQSGATLYGANAGTWPNKGGNANIVPVVANGKVYVASYKGLAIFGLGTPGAAAKIPSDLHAVAAADPLAPGQHEIYGIVHAISGSTIVVQKRDGALVTVDGTWAAKHFTLAPPEVGRGIIVQGSFGTTGVLIASMVQHAKDDPSMWFPDR